MSFSSHMHHPSNAAVHGGDPLKNLAAIRARMDDLHKYLADSVNGQTLLNQSQIDTVDAEISSAIHQVILNAAALLSPPPLPLPNPAQMAAAEADHSSDDADIVEIDAVELLAEHVHFCDVCGKGFKRDANLRMHMRAHGNQFKTVEALTKPGKAAAAPSGEPATKSTMRFSCPYAGCNRNKGHKKFRPLKSVVCVKNHFKRSHCPKMYSCDRCNKKSFAVVADLKSHLKHCGESRWKCSCGTTFSRKDKLFGHMALFEGHMPAVFVSGEERSGVGRDDVVVDDGVDGFFDGLENGFFGSVVDDGSSSLLFGMNGGEDYGMMGGSSGGGGMMDEFFGF